MRKTYSFGPFQVDESERTLLRSGAPVPLTPKAFDVLLLLAERRGQLVSKETLLKEVWPETHVQQAVIHRAMSDLRKALQQTEDEVWIETIPKFGYRLREVSEPVAAPPVDDREKPSEAPSNRKPLWSRYGAVFALIVLGSLTGGSAFWKRSVQSTDLAQVHHLAVLPFQIIGTADQANALSVGIADDFVVHLSGLKTVSIPSISQTRRFTTRSVDPLAAGKELQVEAVLEGALHVSGNAIRADARVINVSDGRAIWVGSAETPSGDMAALEEELLGTLISGLAGNAPKIGRKPEPEAHRLYLAARYEWGRRTRESLLKAASLFRQAIDLDPLDPRAYVGVADCYLLLGGYGYFPQLEMLPKARAMSARALELDPGLAEANTTLAFVAQNLDWDWKKAESHYQKAMELDPNYATAIHWYAEFLSISGRFGEANHMFSRARTADPVSPMIPVDEAQLAFFRRDYERARRLLRRVIEIDPDMAVAKERLAWVDLAQGREEDAWHDACESVTPFCAGALTAWLAKRDPGASDRALSRLEENALKDQSAPFSLVVGYARRGERERAMQWLEFMAEHHSPWLITAKVNPLFDELRVSPRFQSVLRRLHLQS